MMNILKAHLYKIVADLPLVSPRLSWQCRGVMNTKQTTDWQTGLRNFRAKHGLSQRELARLLNNTPRRTLEDWEAGKSKPPVSLELALAHLTGR